MSGAQLGDGTVAIAGIGATEFSKASGRSELALAVEASLAALADAGLSPDAVDGMATFTMETNPENALARALGIGELSFFSRVGFGGGGGCASVMHAAMAVATGVAETVLVYRAFNERSGRRFGQGPPPDKVAVTTENEYRSWVNPHGLLTPAQQTAMVAQRYLNRYGTDPEAFGRVSVLARKHAATNPHAWFYQRPITLADHQNSRWIAEPLRLLDCCQETDGGQALVVTSVERARDLQTEPAVIRAASQGIGPDQHTMVSYYRDDITHFPEVAGVARRLWAQSGLVPGSIDAAVLYDHFTPYVLTQLEDYGFCGAGEAGDFIAEGHLELTGRLPTNTHGGQLGEGYLHGMNGIAEGVRLVRGTSVNQPTGVEHVLVTAGAGVPTSGLVLGVDHERTN
ncbi:lipid-transfer protein [Nocardioides sp. Bht2]|uniref:lipid-transfer protein n=1 Tax=Nocardioides sp. Bht2 TaxID=3392297 RepID=UPI0039B40C42